MSVAGAGVTASATIGRAYNGPPDSAHGGYACAVFARAAGAPPPVAVTLLTAPPLDTPLDVVPGPRRSMIRAGAELVATVTPVAREPEEVAPVDLVTARAATRGFAGRTGHPFPTCFVCGPLRVDGLRLAPGPVPGRPATVACPWTPRGADAPGGELADELLWSVLDCPGGWVAPREDPLVLSRFSVVVPGRVQPGEPHVVVAALISAHERTVTVGSAVHTAAGRLVAKAAAVWTAIPDGLRHTG